MVGKRRYGKDQRLQNRSSVFPVDEEAEMRRENHFGDRRTRQPRGGHKIDANNP